MRVPIAIAIVLAAVACTDPAPQPQPNEMDVVNATRVDPGVAPGALGNESVNYSEGSITPAERGSIYEVEGQSPEKVAAEFANLIVRRRFEEAHQMWDPKAADFTPEQLAQRFEGFRTIQAEIGRAADGAASAGSVEQVQLTLSGTTTEGPNYVLTGPVTLSQATGSAGEQGRWRVVKLVLTANPRAADALIESPAGQ